jgi:hypothetical protein
MKLSGSSSRALIGERFTLAMRNSSARYRHATRAAMVIAPLGLVLGLAACGGGSSKVAATTTTPTSAAAAAAPAGGGGGGGAAGRNSQLAAFRTCMASQGEPLPTFAPRTTTTVPGSTGTAAPDNGTPAGGGRGGGFGGGFGAGGGAGGLGVFLRGLNQNDPKVMAAYNACKAQIPAALIQAQQQRTQATTAFISCMADHGVTIATGPPAAGTTRTTIDQTSTAYQTCKVLLPAGGFGPGRTTTTTTAP